MKTLTTTSENFEIKKNNISIYFISQTLIWVTILTIITIISPL